MTKSQPSSTPNNNNLNNNNALPPPIHAVVIEIPDLDPPHPVDDPVPAHSHHLVVVVEAAEEIVSIPLLLPAVAVDKVPLTMIIQLPIVGEVHLEVDPLPIVE